MRLQTHLMPYDGQRVDGAFVTRIEPCGQPYGQTRPAQKFTGTTLRRFWFSEIR